MWKKIFDVGEWEKRLGCSRMGKTSIFFYVFKDVFIITDKAKASRGGGKRCL
jgi:hypothetical protein